MPVRVQVLRDPLWREDHPGAVVVGGPSPWRNPFLARKALHRSPGTWSIWLSHSKIDLPGSSVEVAHAATEVEARALAVDYFRSFICHPSQRDLRLAGVEALAGRDVACWCPVAGSCHGDVWLELASGVRS